jgi:hypothetical protein
VAWTINGKALCVCDTLLSVITIAQDCPDFNAGLIEKLYEVKWNQHATGPAKERTSSVKAHGKEGL